MPEPCVLEADESGADYFDRMNATGRPVDVWAVDGIERGNLVEGPTGYSYYPGVIPGANLTLLRSGIPPAREADTK